MIHKFEIWSHKLGVTDSGILEGETVGQIVDKLLDQKHIDTESIRGVKMEVDGLVLKLRRKKGGGGR